MLLFLYFPHQTAYFQIDYGISVKYGCGDLVDVRDVCISDVRPYDSFVFHFGKTGLQSGCI